MSNDWVPPFEDEEEEYYGAQASRFQMDPRIRDILTRALGGTDYTVSPMLGGAVEVFMGGQRLATIDMFGEQPVINRYRVESERDIGGQRRISAADRAVQALQAMRKAPDEPDEALMAYLGGRDPGDSDASWNQQRGASYLWQNWQRTTTQAWQHWERSTERISGLEEGPFWAEAVGPTPFRGMVPRGGLRPTERVRSLSAVAEGQVGFPAGTQPNTIRSDIGAGKFVKRGQLQRQAPSLIPVSGPRARPEDLEGKRWPEFQGPVGPVGAGALQWPHQASIRAPGKGVQPESGMRVTTAVSLLGETRGTAGLGLFDPNVVPRQAMVTPFNFPLEKRSLTALSTPNVNLLGYDPGTGDPSSEYARRVQIAMTDKGPLEMEAKWGQGYAAIAWMKEVRNIGSGQVRLIGELEQTREAGSLMSMKFGNKAFTSQMRGLGEQYGIPGLGAVMPRWKSERQGAASAFGAMSGPELRQVMARYGVEWGEKEPLVWDTGRDEDIMRAWEGYKAEHSRVITHPLQVAETMLPAFGWNVGRWEREEQSILTPGTTPEWRSAGNYEIMVDEPFFVGPQLMQTRAEYVGKGRLRSETLGYMVQRGGEMAERAQWLIDKGSGPRTKYTELMNLYLGQTRRGRAAGAQLPQATPLAQLPWEEIQAITGADPKPKELLMAMSQVVGRTPIAMPWGTEEKPAIWASPRTMFEHMAEDRSGELLGLTRAYMTTMRHQFGAGFKATRESDPTYQEAKLQLGGMAGTLGYEREFVQRVQGPGFRREMLSTEPRVGAIQGPVAGSPLMAANEIYVPREGLSKLFGVTDPEQLDILERDIERRGMAFRAAQELRGRGGGLGTFDLAPEDMPFTGQYFRFPTDDPAAQIGLMSVIRTGAEYAKQAGIEGSSLAVSSLIQGASWGDFDADPALVEAVFRHLNINAESGQVDYAPGPAGTPMTEMGVLQRMAQSLMGRGAAPPASMEYADLLDYVWNTEVPGAQLSDLKQKMTQYAAGEGQLESALAFTGNWLNEKGQPREITYNEIWQAQIAEAQAKAMMGMTYQTWGRYTRQMQGGYLDPESERIWSGMFGSTYQEPLDIREVPQPIRSIMEIQSRYNPLKESVARALTPGEYKRDREGNLRVGFSRLAEPAMPQRVAELAAQATGIPGGWSREQTAWMLDPSGTRGGRQQLMGMLEQMDPTQFGKAYMGLYNDPKKLRYEAALGGNAPLMRLIQGRILSTRQRDIGQMTKWGYPYQQTEQEQALAGEYNKARDYVRMIGKSGTEWVEGEPRRFGAHRAAEVLGQAAGMHPELQTIAGEVMNPQAVQAQRQAAYEARQAERVQRTQEQTIKAWAAPAAGMARRWQAETARQQARAEQQSRDRAIVQQRRQAELDTRAQALGGGAANLVNYARQELARRDRIMGSWAKGPTPTTARAEILGPNPNPVPPRLPWQDPSVEAAKAIEGVIDTFGQDMFQRLVPGGIDILGEESYEGKGEAHAIAGRGLIEIRDPARKPWAEDRAGRIRSMMFHEVGHLFEATPQGQKAMKQMGFSDLTGMTGIHMRPKSEVGGYDTGKEAFADIFGSIMGAEHTSYTDIKGSIYPTMARKIDYLRKQMEEFGISIPENTRLDQWLQENLPQQEEVQQAQQQAQQAADDFVVGEGTEHIRQQQIRESFPPGPDMADVAAEEGIPGAGPLSLAQQAYQQFFGGDIEQLRAEARRIGEGGGGGGKNWLTSQARDWIGQQMGAQGFTPEQQAREMGRWGHIVGKVGIGFRRQQAGDKEVWTHDYSRVKQEAQAAKKQQAASGAGAPPQQPPRKPPDDSGYREPPPDWGDDPYYNRSEGFTPPPGSGGGDGGGPSGPSGPGGPPQMPWQRAGDPWISNRQLGELQFIRKQLGEWGQTVAKAIDSTEEINSAQRGFLKTFQKYDTLVGKVSGTIEEMETALKRGRNEPMEWQKAMEDRLIAARAALGGAAGAPGFGAMQGAAGRVAQRDWEQSYREATGRPWGDRGMVFLPGEDGGGGPQGVRARLGAWASQQQGKRFRDYGVAGGIAAGVEHYLSGWELMRLQRMWNLTGAPVFEQFIPAAAQAEMAGWQTATAIGGYMPGVPGGVAGGVMQYGAAQRQSRIAAGRTGYDVWGWTQQYAGALDQARAIAGPAVGAGLIGGTLASTAAAPFIGAQAALTTIGLPVMAGVGSLASAVAFGNLAVSRGQPTVENLQRLRAGGVEGWINRGLAEIGYQASTIDQHTTPQMATEVTNQWRAQAETQAWTPLGQLPQADQAGMLNVMADVLQGAEGSIFSGLDSGQILQYMGEFAPYIGAEGFQLANLEQWAGGIGGVPEGMRNNLELLEQLVGTGQSIGSYQQIAGQYRMGSSMITRMLRELGPKPESERRALMTALGQYSGMTAVGYTPQDIYGRVMAGTLQKREGTGALALEMAYGATSQATQAFGMPAVGVGAQGLLGGFMGATAEGIAQAQLAIPYAGMVAQGLNLAPGQAMNQYWGYAAQGLTPQTMGLMAQAQLGQGAVGQALGLPGGFAFDQQFAQLLGQQAINPVQYQQFASLGRIAQSTMGKSMMAAGVGIGPQLAQVRQMAGLPPLVDTYQSMYDFSQPGYVYGMNELAMRGVQQNMNVMQYQRQMGMGQWASQTLPAEYGGATYQMGLRGDIAEQGRAIGVFQQQRALRSELFEQGVSNQQSNLAYQMAMASLQYRQAMESVDLQERMWGTRRRFASAEMGMQWQGMMQTREWGREDFAFNRQVAGMEFEWQQEDLDRAIRFATGREKSQLIRQRERSEERFATQETRRGTQEERQEKLWQQEEERFALQKQQFEEIGALEKEQFDMRRRHLTETFNLQMSHLQEQMGQIGRNAELQRELQKIQDDETQRRMERQLAEMMQTEEYYQQRFAMEQELTRLQNEVADARAAQLADELNVINGLKGAVQELMGVQPAAGIAPEESGDVNLAGREKLNLIAEGRTADGGVVQRQKKEAKIARKGAQAGGGSELTAEGAAVMAGPYDLSGADVRATEGFGDILEQANAVLAVQQQVWDLDEQMREAAKTERETELGHIGTLSEWRKTFFEDNLLPGLQTVHDAIATMATDTTTYLQFTAEAYRAGGKVYTATDSYFDQIRLWWIDQLLLLGIKPQGDEFQHGAQFTVRGGSGIDTIPVNFMATAGETVTVTPAGATPPPSYVPALGGSQSSGGGGVSIGSITIQVPPGNYGSADDLMKAARRQLEDMVNDLAHRQQSRGGTWP